MTGIAVTEWRYVLNAMTGVMNGHIPTIATGANGRTNARGIFPKICLMNICPRFMTTTAGTAC